MKKGGLGGANSGTVSQSAYGDIRGAQQKRKAGRVATKAGFKAGLNSSGAKVHGKVVRAPKQANLKAAYAKHGLAGHDYGQGFNKAKRTTAPGAKVGHGQRRDAKGRFA